MSGPSCSRRSAVTATHGFLATGDIEHYEQRIRTDYLPALAAGLSVAEVGGRVVGFSAVAEGTLEMLFVAARPRPAPRPACSRQ